MTYTWVALAGVAVAVLMDLAIVRTRLLCGRAFWTAYAIMLFFQLIVNGVLTGLPVVRYDPEAILGWRIVHAPVEDVLFGFALVSITLTLWVRLAALAPPRPDR
jgi:lycopene cyclase domain-containing protein